MEAFDDALLTLNSALGSTFPIPILPAEVTRNLSVPSVFIVNVPVEGNLIEVSVSPVCRIESAIDT